MAPNIYLKSCLLRTGLVLLATEDLNPHLTKAFTSVGVLRLCCDAAGDNTHCCRILSVLLLLPPLSSLAVPSFSQGKSPAVP